MAQAFRDRAKLYISSQLGSIAERAAKRAGPGYAPDLRAMHAELQQLQPLVQAGPRILLRACRPAVQMADPAWETKSRLMDGVTCRQSISCSGLASCFHVMHLQAGSVCQDAPPTTPTLPLNIAGFRRRCSRACDRLCSRSFAVFCTLACFMHTAAHGALQRF